jgi:hypothetical protein
MGEQPRPGPCGPCRAAERRHRGAAPGDGETVLQPQYVRGNSGQTRRILRARAVSREPGTIGIGLGRQSQPN